MSNKYLKLKVLVFAASCLTVAICGLAQPLRVGVFSGRAATAVEEIQKTLEENGYETGVFTGSGRKTTITDIYDYDVLFFGGGWGAMNWLSREDQMHLVEFVEQRGGGVIFSMFRCGTVARSMIRPIFPEIAYAYNKINSRGMRVVDPEHPVMKDLPEEFITPFWDHAVMQLGQYGKTLAVNTAGETSIAAGESGHGRVVFIGPWIGLCVNGQPTYPLDENDQKLLLNSVQWAGTPKTRDKSKLTELSERTRLKVMRREAILDWTQNERGKSMVLGLLTRARFSREQELDSIAMKLDRYMPGAGQSGAAAQMLELRDKITTLNSDLQLNYDQAVNRKTRQISNMSIEELEADPLHGTNRRQQGDILKEWQNRLLFQHLLDTIAGQVNRVATELEPELEKFEAQNFAAARADDARKVSTFISELSSEDPLTRANAAMELGRIGDTGRKTETALIRALADNDRTVRRNAIYALSWTQSKNAVPDLMKILDTHEDKTTRRRAAQALGQIGAARALPALIKAAEIDNDIHVRYNSILALGWIGDAKAVDALLKIAEKSLENVDMETNTRTEQNACPHNMTLACAIRALSHLGDKKALPFLEENDFPSYSGMRTPSVNLAEEAVSMINGGGRAISGISQLDILRDVNHFYWMTSRYNALMGRYILFRGEPDDSDLMLSYTDAAGGAGTVEFITVDRWIDTRENIDIDQHFNHASKLGLKINMQMPIQPHLVNKALFEREVMRLADYASFGGLWLEECISLDGPTKAAGDQAFRDFLTSRYTSDELAELGITDIETVVMPQPDSGKIYERDGARADKVVFAEYLEFAASIGVDNWAETRDFVAGMRKGAKSSYSLSNRYIQGGSTFINAYPRINLALDAAGPQSYGAHSSMNNFNLDMHVDGESRPAQGEFYAHQADTPGRVERGFASSFIYGQQFFNWWWGHIFKHPPLGNLGALLYDPGRWEAAVRQFNKGKAISEYLAPRDTTGARLVTQLYSGRTTTLTYGDGMIDSFGGRGKTASQSPSGYAFRYSQNQQALWESLIRSHLPVEMTWLETQHPAKLAQWKVAVLGDGVSLEAKEVEMLREWVANGGTLVATASSTLHDQWDRKQKNYSLADVFGIDYVETKGEPSLIYMERDIKPATGITEIRMTSPDYFLHMEGAVAAEYEKNIGYDVIKPTTAKVVGVWDDDTPAVTENKFGQGHAIFISARYPALSHLTREWTVDNLYKIYWPGMRELIAASVRRGAELAGTQIPVLVENCPETVDVVLKRQDQNNRWMVHLLNIDENNGLIQDVKIIVTPPQTVKSVYYAYPEKTKLPFTTNDNTIEFTVRPFDVHEMVVIEFN